MYIGAVGFSPYIYNTNTLSGSSLSRVSAIGDDLTSKKTDYSALTDSSLNINPLGRGESASFFDILDMQMQLSRRNASRIMMPEEPVQNAGVSEQGILAETGAEALSSMEMPENIQAADDRNVNDMQAVESASEGAAEDAVTPAGTAIDTAEAVEDFKPVSASEEALSMQYDRNLFRMQKAAEAYRVNMIA